MKILIADDDAVLRSELAGLLREDGHDVVSAADGGEAMRLVERESFDAALLDLRMPKATAIEAHIAGVDRPVIYAADLSLLQAVHGLADMKAWVHHMNGRCAARGGVLILSSEDRGLAEQSETEGPHSERLQAMLESLANPIRRSLVGFVVASGPVAYSAILRKNFVDSSSKLSFHLQKLQSDGLLAKGDAGRYEVTESGQRAWHVVRALADRKPPSLLISKS